MQKHTDDCRSPSLLARRSRRTEGGTNFRQVDNSNKLGLSTLDFARGCSETVLLLGRVVGTSKAAAVGRCRRRSRLRSRVFRICNSSAGVPRGVVKSVSSEETQSRGVDSGDAALSRRPGTSVATCPFDGFPSGLFIESMHHMQSLDFCLHGSSIL